MPQHVVALQQLSPDQLVCWKRIMLCLLESHCCLRFLVAHAHTVGGRQAELVASAHPGAETLSLRCAGESRHTARQTRACKFVSFLFIFCFEIYLFCIRLNLNGFSLFIFFWSIFCFVFVVSLLLSMIIGSQGAWSAERRDARATSRVWNCEIVVWKRDHVRICLLWCCCFSFGAKHSEYLSALTKMPFSYPVLTNESFRGVSTAFGESREGGRIVRFSFFLLIVFFF